MKRELILTAFLSLPFLSGQAQSTVMEIECPHLGSISDVNKVLELKGWPGWKLLNPNHTSNKYPLNDKIRFDPSDEALKVDGPHPESHQCRYDIEYDPKNASMVYPVGQFYLVQK